MITICPFCKNELERTLNNGIVYCYKCNHLIESNMKNKLLSLFRHLEQSPNSDLKKIKFQTQADEDEILFVMTFKEQNYSFEEFGKTLTKFFG